MDTPIPDLSMTKIFITTVLIWFHFFFVSQFATRPISKILIFILAISLNGYSIYRFVSATIIPFEDLKIAPLDSQKKVKNNEPRKSAAKKQPADFDLDDSIYRNWDRF